LADVKSGSSAAALRKSSYVYYEQLSFLQKVVASKPTTSSFNRESIAAENVEPLSNQHDSSISSGNLQAAKEGKRRKESMIKVMMNALMKLTA